MILKDLGSSLANGNNVRQIYTDGGCYNTGNSGDIGSFAFLEPVDMSSEMVVVYGGYLDSTTNNRTEMLAIINAIKTICETGTTVNIISDSGYVVKGYTDPAYLDKWVANGWKTSNKKPVMNQDLWEEMLKLGWSNAFYFTHIRGHKKDKNHLHAYWNDIVDKCCTYLMKECKQDGKMFKMVYNLKTESIVRVEEYKNERCK